MLYKRHERDRITKRRSTRPKNLKNDNSMRLTLIEKRPKKKKTFQWIIKRLVSVTDLTLLYNAAVMPVEVFARGTQVDAVVYVVLVDPV